MGFFDNLGNKTSRLSKIVGHKMRRAYKIGKKVASHSVKIGKRVAGSLEHIGKKSANTLHDVRKAVEETDGIGDMIKAYEGIPIPQLGGLTANQILNSTEEGLRLGGRTAGGIKNILGSKNYKQAIQRTGMFARNEGRDVAKAIRTVVKNRNTKSSSS